MCSIPRFQARGAARLKVARRMRHSTFASQAGFTLVEMAVVMSIMGVVLMGATAAMTGRVGVAKIKSTSDRMDIVEDAISTFYGAYDRLPCPANGSLAPGHADYGRALPETSGACDSSLAETDKVLPWVTLRLQEANSLDGWDRRFRYFATASLTTEASDQPGNLTVRNGPASNSQSQVLANDAAYTLISHGGNGLGGWLRTGASYRSTGITAGELLNLGDASLTFIDGQLSSFTEGSFDDIVRWRTKRGLLPVAGQVVNTTEEVIPQDICDQAQSNMNHLYCTRYRNHIYVKPHCDLAELVQNSCNS